MNDEDYRKASKYLGVNAAQVVQSLQAPVTPDLYNLVQTILIVLWKARIRPSAQLRYQQRLRAQSRCVICGQPTWRLSSSYCETHRSRHR